jgi:hypothetical protein
MYASPSHCLSQDWDIIQNLQQLSQFQTIQYLTLGKEDNTTSTSLLTSSNLTHQEFILPTTQPYITINGVTIVNKIHTILRKHSRDKDITNYLCSKNNWSEVNFKSFLWKEHSKAHHQFTGRIRKTVTQFIHGWLPVNTLHSVRKCPCCQQAEETQEHFLCRLNTSSQSEWISSASKIHQKLKKIQHQGASQLIKNHS